MKKIVKLFLRENTVIDVLYSDGKVKRYDILLMVNDYPILNELKNRDLFLKGKVLGCSGIKWNDDIDIDGDSIYSDGKTVILDEPIENYLLGFKLKEARLKKGLSQANLAFITKIDQGDISKIESGVANPTIGTLRRLCNALNKNLSVIIG